MSEEVRESLLTLSDDKYGVWIHLTLFKETKGEKTNMSLCGEKYRIKKKRTTYMRVQEKKS